MNALHSNGHKSNRKFFLMDLCLGHKQRIQVLPLSIKSASKILKDCIANRLVLFLFLLFVFVVSLERLFCFCPTPLMIQSISSRPAFYYVERLRFVF